MLSAEKALYGQVFSVTQIQQIFTVEKQDYCSVKQMFDVMCKVLACHISTEFSSILSSQINLRWEALAYYMSAHESLRQKQLLQLLNVTSTRPMYLPNLSSFHICKIETVYHPSECVINNQHLVSLLTSSILLTQMEIES